MSRKKSKKKRRPPTVADVLAAAHKGPPTNVRAGGPMADRRLRRRRTRQAEQDAEIAEG